MALLLFLIGMFFLTTSITCFLVFRPRKGRIHPWVTKPVLQAGIPLAIVGSGLFGLAALTAAFFE
jgi:hypothetical protein